MKRNLGLKKFKVAKLNSLSSIKGGTNPNPDGIPGMETEITCKENGCIGDPDPLSEVWRTGSIFCD